MSYRLISSNHRCSTISPAFDTIEAARQFGRDHWASIKRSHATEVSVVDDDGCLDAIWRLEATPANKVEPAYYAVDGKRYHINRPDEGKWAGWTFVTTGSDYHDRKTIAMARPDGSVVKLHPVLTAICADPFARAAEYGRITGTCAACGRKLEDPDSRAIGLGPICRQKFGV